MTSLDYILNPLPTPSPTSSTSTIMHRSPRPKKQKMAKDAAIFQRGRPKGDVRYPPCDIRDDELASLHRDFRIYPFGNIADYPRHIPYNSNKKSFQERTGRESFEVFQYTFQLPGEEKQWLVMWDYNIGLVRITHLFKCNGHTKTAPAKMLNQNPGLRDICHSITGGAIAAQGYWMPYEAAKAISSTFCWKIRYALTPLFGVDFPSSCIPPNDRSRFGRMVIDPSIVQIATEKANYYRILELRCSPPDSLRTEYPLRPSSVPIRDRDRSRVGLGRHILPKAHHHRHHRSNSPASTDTSLVGYGSSPEIEYYSSGPEPYCLSPVSPIRGSFTPVNTPRSTDIYSPTSSSRLLPSPHELLASLSAPISTSRLRARARAPRARAIPSSAPSNDLRTIATRGNTSFAPAPSVAVRDGSDIDADAETDINYDCDLGININMDIDTDGASSDESTSSTTASSSGSSMSITPDGASCLYPNGDNAIDDDESHQDIHAEMIDSRASKRRAAADQRQGRRIYSVEYQREHERGLERRHGRVHIESHRRTNTEGLEDPSKSMRMSEVDAAHALVMMQGTPASDVQVKVKVDNGRSHEQLKEEPIKNENKPSCLNHCRCDVSCRCHAHACAHSNSNRNENPIISPCISSEKKRRRASF